MYTDTHTYTYTHIHRNTQVYIHICTHAHNYLHIDTYTTHVDTHNIMHTWDAATTKYDYSRQQQVKKREQRADFHFFGVKGKMQ